MTLFVGWQEGHLACKRSHTSHPQTFGDHCRPGLTWSGLWKNNTVKQKKTSGASIFRGVLSLRFNGRFPGEPGLAGVY